MKLNTDWKKLLLRAWSIRFILLAGFLSAVEIILPLFANDIPRGTFAALSGMATMGALVSRVVVQRGLDEKEDEDDSKN